MELFALEQETLEKVWLNLLKFCTRVPSTTKTEYNPSKTSKLYVIMLCNIPLQSRLNILIYSLSFNTTVDGLFDPNQTVTGYQ